MDGFDGIAVHDNLALVLFLPLPGDVNEFGLLRGEAGLSSPGPGFDPGCALGRKTLSSFDRPTCIGHYPSFSSSIRGSWSLEVHHASHPGCLSLLCKHTSRADQLGRHHFDRSRPDSGPSASEVVDSRLSVHRDAIPVWVSAQASKLMYQLWVHGSGGEQKIDRERMEELLN